MIEKKFNWKIRFFITLFAIVLVLALNALFLIATNKLIDEDGTPLHPFLKILLFIMIIPVLVTYADTEIKLLKRVTKHNNTAFTIDETGIHNTLVFVNIFAFVIVSEIKLIPWSAVCYIDCTDEDSVYIRVKRKQISSTSVGKLIIGILGYHFCYSFTASKLSREEKSIIAAYCKEQPNCRTPENISRLRDIF